LPKLPRLTALEAETMLTKAGFKHLRTKGSHRIYIRNGVRVVLPFHAGKVLHPKIVKQVMTALDEN
jgi:predicted RNA binding protein YcfA (HicA-like mRNA interferase family)